MLPYWASLASILRTSLDGVVIVDARGGILGWNDSAERVFGWSEQEAMRRPIADLVVPVRLKDIFVRRLASLVSDPHDRLIGRRLDMIACRKDGREFALEFAVMAMRTAEDDVLLVGFARDVTAQRQAAATSAARATELEQAQERLRQSEELYRYVVELSNLIPWTADDDGRILTIGPRWVDWTGAEIAAGLGEGWLAFLHAEDVMRVLEEWGAALAAGDEIAIEYRLCNVDGQYRWCEARARKRVDPHDGPAIWYGTLEDIHERRTATEASLRLQSELIHVSRLSAMGAMASVIAHDLNQPLTAAAHYIRGGRQLLQAQSDTGFSDIIEALDDADRNVVRAGEIVRRTREFVSRGTVECRPESLSDLITDACRIALAGARTDSVSYRCICPVDFDVLVDGVQIQQVLVNLLRNALHAVKGGDRREITIRTADGPADQCLVQVTDTGPGLPPDAADRIFDPFYTTRSDGMGLGLSISRTIIEAHGGTIWARDEPAGGTTVSFTLPKSG